jgi:hypothetical protein
MSRRIRGKGRLAMIATRRSVAGWCTGLAVGLGLWASTGTAAAQELPCGTCGPAGLRARLMPGVLQGHKYRPPVISPASCFGYFKTQWTPWEVACPNWYTDAAHHPVAVGPVVPAPVPAINGALPAPTPAAPAPASVPPREMEKAPAPSKPPGGQTSVPLPPGAIPGLGLPPIPELQIGLPPEAPRASGVKTKY